MSQVVNCRFLTQEITGVQRYGIEICLALKKMNSSITFISPKNILHKDLAEELGVFTYGVFTGHLWEQLELPRYLKSRGSPLLLNLGNTAPLLYSNKISTVHDVAFERYPKSFSWQFRFFYQFLIPRVVRTSKRIFTVSEFSKKELCEFYNIEPSSISVVYNAVSSAFEKDSKPFGGTYILAVSSLSYQKNFHGLIKAFLSIKNQAHNLYLVGGFNRNFADPTLIKIVDANPRIHFMGRVPDEELAELYRGASCFVYPSFYEGFGIPPLEAQACGCPVIVAKAASLPEVCRDSALYCSPHDINDIAEKIELVLSSPDISRRLISDGYDNIQRFSWKKSAQKLLEAIGE